MKYVVIVLSIVSLALAARVSGQKVAAGNSPDQRPAPRSLDSLQPEPVKDAGTHMVLSKPGGQPLDPILQILGTAPKEPPGEFLKQTPASEEPITVFQVLKNGDVLFGQNAGLKRHAADDPHTPLRADPSWSSPIDFWYDGQNRKLHVRSLLLTENGDAPDIGLRRSGDGTYPNGPPLASRRNQNLGIIHWMGWAADAGFDDRSAQIHARAAEDITSKGAGGTLHFATTPIGSTGAPVDRIIIASNGNIGIGAAAPAASLHVVRGTGAGFVEDYYSADALEPGDVVVIAPGADQLSVVKSTAAYDQKVVGVVSGDPAIRVTEYLGDPEQEHKFPRPNQFPVSVAGRVSIKVSAENGPIQPGDYLTSSSTPGVAMKATKKGAVVGKALESHSGESAGQIKMLADVTWFMP